MERGVHERARRERAHAAGVRAPVAVEDALVILRGADRERPRAVAHDEERDLGAGQAFLDDELRARRAESALAHDGDDRRLGLRAIPGDDDALAGGEAVGLEHERPAEFAGPGDAERFVGGCARAEPGGRHAVTRHERLRERLARLEGGGGPCRSEDGAPSGGKPVGDAEAERQLGPDDGEVDALAFGEAQEGVRIGEVGREGAGEARDAGIAGSGDHLADAWVAGQAGDQGVLAGADPRTRSLIGMYGEVA